MSPEVEVNFDSIESAHEFVALLAEAVAGAKHDIAGDIQRETGSKYPRRQQALQIAFYNLEKLELHMRKSRRILNDLRSLRRLLFEERKRNPRAFQTAVVSNRSAASPANPDAA